MTKHGDREGTGKATGGDNGRSVRVGREGSGPASDVSGERVRGELGQSDSLTSSMALPSMSNW